MQQLGHPGLLFWALNTGVSTSTDTNFKGHECGVADEKLETILGVCKIIVEST